MNRGFASLVLLFVTCLVAPRFAFAVVVDTVSVGNPGNAPDSTSLGSVGYVYNIGTTDVTNAQYTAFLNAKAASDPLGLYNTNMGSSVWGGITRSGSSGSFTYATITGRGSMPVVYVSWYDAIRFANWLSNGQGSGSTETGAYTLRGGTATPSNGLSIARNPGATWFLPSENEWYKAAYYDPSTSSYFTYPTGSNSVPTAEAPPGGSNSANYRGAAGGNLTNAGAYTGTKSPYGAFDMAGNVWQWNEALSGSLRNLRGAPFNASVVMGSSSSGIFNDGADEAPSFGFRLATVPAMIVWIGTTNTGWTTPSNWSSAVPGSTNGTMNGDTATFNQNAPLSPLTIDAGRNIQSITFDTASVNSLTIGTIGGNALFLTVGGTIQTTSTVINPQTVNAPLALGGDYTFTSGASSNSATLSFGGGSTPAATSGITTLTLNGTNTGENTIRGVLADNGAGRLAVTKSGPGLWILSGANTNSGDIAVTGGTLRFNITSGKPTIAAGVTATVAGGATLELAGSVSALGTAGGNRAHVINSSTAPGVLVSGTHQVVGRIDGTGNVQVNDGSDLTADHIIQNALVIGGSDGSPARVMIAASDSSGNPLGEPSTLALAGSLTPSNSFGDGVNSVNLLDGPAISDSGSTAGFPSGSPGGVGSSTVPEPSTMLFFILAMAGLAASRLLRSLPYRFTAIANLNQSRFS